MEHVDAVVVGSGFGGAVAAYRLADAGLSVVVLERGRPYPPGDFPRGPAQLARAFWDPSESLYGMYDVWSFRDCDSVVSSGLGGGSLIYANVLLRKDEDWFVHEESLPKGGYESWPVSRAELDAHYDAVEQMIGVSPYPLGHPAFGDTLKTLAMRDAAAELGLDWRLPPLAVSFAPSRGAEPGLGLPIAEPEYGNVHGRVRRTCRQCGECDLGCNDGAKNSLDHTYLSAARRRGADLRTLHQVRAVRPRVGGGYDVEYVEHMPPVSPDDDDRRRPRWTGPHTISCDRLVLAAGTYGTTHLLLKNRAAFPGLSRALGTRFSGNGDLLAFLLRATDRSRTRPIQASRGPVITSAIRLEDGPDGRGAYIEEGGYPAFVDYLVEAADLGGEAGRAGRFLLERLRGLVTHDTNLSAEIAGLLGRGELSGTSLPLLGMGRDVPDGELRLRDGRLDVVWTAETSDAYYERLRATMRRIGHVLGAEYADSPSWWRKRVMTVHPLGGAPMGRHPGEGVCDPYGEVFGFPGLYVADGAAMPGPVGANPALTIAALSDRMCTRMLETPTPTAARVTAAPEPVAGPDDPPPVFGERTSLWFVEEMRGFLGVGRTDPRSRMGTPEGGHVTFRLTITVDDIAAFLGDPGHRARAEGWIDTAVCGGRRPIARGWFNLFVPGEAPDRRRMNYRLHFWDADNRPRTLSGYKDVHHGPPTRLWLDTSTLYARLLEGHVDEGGDDDAKVVAAGTLHILPSDLARMLTTFRTAGPDGTGALTRFCGFFLGELWDIYRPRQGS
ncbi:GMC oxidoreductase [Microbispora sp. ATCC PTA-5024]|uniref:GMC oxidoreductase n=1 Tax=Microbispora sp. ATCC PTA-5024 TaxID=316330 RepID=UPI000403EF3C|nr:GMC family oxidoreductase [Microbispora sp. ATCC PTA-5024]